MDALESLLTVREVATYLACAEETVKRLVRRGELPATRIGTRLRFARADVEAYQAAHSAQPIAHRVPAQVDKRISAYPRLPMQRPTSAAAYLTQLQLITGVFTQLHTPSQAAELVLRQCVRALDASSGLLSLVREGQVLDLVHAIGYRSGALDQWRRMALDAPLPLPDVVRRGEPRFFETVTALHAHYPQIADVPATSAAWAIIPLPIDDYIIGGIVLAFARPRTFSMDDRAFLLALAQQCAQAIDRARLHAAEQGARAEVEAAREQLAMLAGASMELAMSLDVQRTLETLARLAVPRLADWCVVDMLMEDRTIQTLVVAHADPAREAIGWDMVRRYAIDPDAPGGTAAVLRTQHPELVPEIPDTMLAMLARDEEHLRMLRALGLRSSLCVPLVARGRALGTIALVAAESGRRYSEADLPFVEDLARRAALAVDNARLYREAQAAIGLRDTFFSIAAHELRTPLTSLLGQAQLIQRRAQREGDLGERYQQSLRVIEHQATRLNTMILAMLDTARLEQGRLRLEWQPVNLRDLIERVVEEIQPTLDRHIITLIAEDEPLIVIGDMLRLEQVAQNVIGNAVKYSPRGGPVGVQLRRLGDRAQIVVRDEGIGIPAAAIPLLFQRFYRAGNVDAQHISGMGIGLYVVKEIVALHGGTVAVESVEQQGSTFSVFLPLAEAS